MDLRMVIAKGLTSTGSNVVDAARTALMHHDSTMPLFTASASGTLTPYDVRLDSLLTSALLSTCLLTHLTGQSYSSAAVVRLGRIQHQLNSESKQDHRLTVRELSSTLFYLYFLAKWTFWYRWNQQIFFLYFYVTLYLPELSTQRKPVPHCSI